MTSVGYDDIDLLTDLKWFNGDKIINLMKKNKYEFVEDVINYTKTRNEIWLQDFLIEQRLSEYWKYIADKPPKDYNINKRM